MAGPKLRSTEAWQKRQLCRRWRRRMASFTHSRAVAFGSVVVVSPVHVTRSATKLSAVATTPPPETTRAAGVGAPDGPSGDYRVTAGAVARGLTAALVAVRMGGAVGAVVRGVATAAPGLDVPGKLVRLVPVHMAVALDRGRHRPHPGPVAD